MCPEFIGAPLLGEGEKAVEKESISAQLACLLGYLWAFLRDLLGVQGMMMLQIIAGLLGDICLVSGFFWLLEIKANSAGF